MDDTALTAIANRLRFLILTMTHAVGSGHPTTSFSSVELMTMLFFRHLRAESDHPDDRANDRVIFSKGHASALFYALYCVAGIISEDDLKGYRMSGSPLEGHPTFRFPFTEAATGSLGQGLSIATGEAEGMRLAHTRSDAQNDATPLPNVFCLLGDGELAEGSVWEAASWAGFRKTPNLVAIIDANGLGQSGPTMEEGDAEVLARRFESFGWATIKIDGHDFNQIDAAYTKARGYTAGPVAIIARTVKGKGIALWEGKDGWHNKMLPAEELEKAKALFGKKEYAIRGVVAKPGMDDGSVRHADASAVPARPGPSGSYIGLVPTKKAYGAAIMKLGTIMPQLLVLDGDVANSLHTEEFAKTLPDQFFRMYIAEQEMAGAAIGLARVGFYPVINTFAAFVTRAHDQMRMMPLSNVSLLVHGSYGGVSVGRDGPSQMGLEDLALMRSIFGSTVVYPSDPYQTEYLLSELVHTTGVSYIRTTREPTPVLYAPGDAFPVGGSRVFAGSAAEQATVVAAGITLHEALKTQRALEAEGIAIRVIDAYSVKPVDGKTLVKAAKETKRFVVVEDHYPEGGLGDAVREALDGSPVPLIHLAVTKLPSSGSPAELLAFEGIDAAAIAAAVRKIIGVSP